MSKKSLKILFLFDMGQAPPKDHDYAEIFRHDDWKPEADLLKTIKELGHEVRCFGLFNDIRPLLDELTTNKHDLVFNQCEAFAGLRDHEPNITALLELLNIPYTGASTHALEICKDKSLTKKILLYHRIRVPRFVVSKRTRPLKSFKKFPFPAFIKPIKLEGSEGIAQLSFTENEKDTLERVKFIHDSFETDAIVEEYIDGREVYVGVFGNKQLTVLPPRELFFSQVPEGEPKIATFRAKWDDAYRKKWGIKSGHAKTLPPKIEKILLEISRKIYKLFQIQGYARIDYRVNEKNEIVFIEANPNPSIAADEDFAAAAQKAEIKYADLIDQIINLAFLKN